MSKVMKQFMEMVLADCTKSGVDAKFINKKSVKTEDGVPCAGYFSEDELVVAIGGKKKDWFQVLVHEYCHMQQWKEDHDLWVNCTIMGADKGDLLFNWLNGIIELNDEQLRDYVRHSRNLELDCERRVVDMIHKYNLPIDPVLYIQKANSYVLFYDIIAITRKWYKPGRSPYSIPDIYNNMPTEFISDDYDITECDIELYKLIVDID